MRPLRSLAAVALSFGAAVAAAAPLAGDVFRFDIGATRLEDGLQQLADETGVILAYDRRDALGVRTTEVRGEMSVEQALRRMLSGTGLDYRYDEFSGQVLIAPRLSRHWRPRHR